jgi:glycosyltransferase involved in cell wall biosynthesis
MAENAIRKADVLVSISDFDRAYASRVRDGIVMKIPNAIRPGFFERAPEFPDSARINFSGVIIKRKNVLGLVRAFKKIREKVPEAILDIAGPVTEPEYFEEVKQTIDSSVQDAVIFHGNLGSDTLIEVTRQASVCVLFSVYENLPVVIGEALSLGKPVVASRVGAVEEMVDDGKTGFIVESGDEQSLVDRVVQLLSDKNLRVRMGTRGRERATSTWKPESVVAETLEAYRVAIRTRQQLSGVRAIVDGESVAV